MRNPTTTPRLETARRGVLFIHGFGGDRRQYQPIIRFLRRNNFGRFYEFTYRQNVGQVPIADIAKQLHDFVRSTIHEPSIDCIAISQGGIIARYYIQHYNGSLIRRCVTICTPHQGSWLAYLLPWRGLVDLRPSSDMLRQLRESHDQTAYACVWTPFDCMVLPGWNAKLSGARRTRRVWSLAHPLAMRSRTTLHFVLAHLIE